MGKLNAGLAKWLKTHKRGTKSTTKSTTTKSKSGKMPMMNGKPAWLSQPNKKGK